MLSLPCAVRCEWHEWEKAASLDPGGDEFIVGEGSGRALCPQLLGLLQIQSSRIQDVFSCAERPPVCIALVSFPIHHITDLGM